MDTTITSPFRIAPSVYAGAIMRLWLKRWWWTVAILPSLSIALAFYLSDIKYLLLAFVMICLVIPPLLLIIYYYYALDPRARVNIPPHTIECSNETITITFIADHQPIPESDSYTSDEISTEAPPPPVTINLTNIYQLRHSNGYIIISLDKSHMAPFILIPYSAFQTPEQLRQLISMIK